MFNLKFTRFIFTAFCLPAAILLAAQNAAAQINIGGMNISLPKRPSKPKPSQTGNPKDDTTAMPFPKQSGDVELAADEIEVNKTAPADYDPNLNFGDQAVAITHFRELHRVKILAKSGGNYKTVDLDDPRLVFLYKANSVYPYFDGPTFQRLMYRYGEQLKPYLHCYAQKHNLTDHDMTGDELNTLPISPFGMNAAVTKKHLQDDQSQLAQLEIDLKTQIQTFPNTFSNYVNNPIIAEEIVSHRDEYLNCAVDAVANKPSPILPVFLEDIGKAKSQVERYQPGRNIYLVSAGAQSEELLRAVSPKARAEWSAKWLANSPLRAKFDAAWDALAASAKDKIPLYKPAAAGFQFRYPAGEKLLLDSFKNSSTLKIFRIGTDTASWDIQKDSADLLPTYRYKDVRVYLRDSSDDHPYCKVVTARVKQNYSGGGTYNSTVYRAPVSEEIYGCP